jgi:hypothetical protein
MKSLPIPKTDQIAAMLDGSFPELLRQYIDYPNSVELGKFITVKREELLDWLLAHPDVCDSYIQKQSEFTASHDVEKIIEEPSGYVVVSMYRGEQRSPRRFKILADAVAEHVLLSHGLY